MAPFPPPCPHTAVGRTLTSVIPELPRAFGSAPFWRSGPREASQPRSGPVPLPARTGRIQSSVLNTNKVLPQLRSPVGFCKRLPSPAFLVLTAARGQQEAATYRILILRFSFLLQARFCKFMRSKLCRHTTCVCPFDFSSFLHDNQECFSSCSFSGYPFPFSLSVALYGTITFVELKALIVPSTMFYNISSVFFKKTKKNPKKYDVFV